MSRKRIYGISLSQYGKALACAQNVLLLQRSKGEAFPVLLLRNSSKVCAQASNTLLVVLVFTMRQKGFRWRYSCILKVFFALIGFCHGSFVEMILIILNEIRNVTVNCSSRDSLEPKQRVRMNFSLYKESSL